MAIIRWDAYRDALALQHRLNGLFQDPSRTSDPGTAATAGFVPAVDIYEDEHKVVLKIEVPGVKAENVDVRLENNTLTVKGERNFQSEGKEENFRRVERRYGSFSRAFTVPSTIDPEGIQATYDAGILSVELTKKPESKPKQIKVNVAAESAKVA